jgi:hypothetical protein
MRGSPRRKILPRTPSSARRESADPGVAFPSIIKIESSALCSVATSSRLYALVGTVCCSSSVIGHQFRQQSFSTPIDEVNRSVAATCPASLLIGSARTCSFQSPPPNDRCWRFRRLQPKSTFSRFPPVHRNDLKGQLGVGAALVLRTVIGSERRIPLVRAVRHDGKVAPSADTDH